MLIKNSYILLTAIFILLPFTVDARQVPNIPFENRDLPTTPIIPITHAEAPFVVTGSNCDTSYFGLGKYIAIYTKNIGKCTGQTLYLKKDFIEILPIPLAAAAALLVLFLWYTGRLKLKQ